LTISNGDQDFNEDVVYQILYDTPKSTLFFNNIPTTINPDSIVINPNNRGVRKYGVFYNNGTIPGTRKIEELVEIVQLPPHVSQVIKSAKPIK
jgi:hypothetical protein